MTEPEFRCVICGKAVTIWFETAVAKFPEHEGTLFSAAGNYGSTQWDPMDDSECLEIAICNDCLPVVSRKGYVQHRLDISRHEWEYTIWKAPQ